MAVVPANAAFLLRSIIIAGQIERFDIVVQTQNSVGASAGHIHQEAVVGRQLGAEPPAIGGRIRPDVENRVVKSAANAPYNLHLRRRGKLIVHAAYRAAFDGERVVDLNEFALEAELLELPAAKHPGKETARVLELLQLYQARAVNRRFANQHVVPSMERSRPAQIGRKAA